MTKLIFLLHLTAGLTLAKPLIYSYSGDYGSMDILGPSLQRRAFPPVDPDCRLAIPTDIFTTCGSFLKSYNITLPLLYSLNKWIEPDCYSFQPGATYCIRQSNSRPKSKDGKCGRQAPTPVTCEGSGFGDCCSAAGECGSTESHCGIGNCQDGICPGLGYTTDGTCGSKFGFLKCGGQWGKCCSTAGKCGNTSAECGKGNCQSGECEAPTTTSAISTSSRTPTPLPPPFKPSPDGTCGFQNKYKCTDTAFFFGYCCSKEGFCGTSARHCDDLLGCQSEYGLCDKTVVVTSIDSGPGSSSVTKSPPKTTTKPSPTIAKPTTRKITTTTTAKPPTKTSTKPTIVTPTPTQSGMTKGCTGWRFAQKGDTCANIVTRFQAAPNKLTLANLLAWNPALGKDCKGLKLGFYLCIRK